MDAIDEFKRDTILLSFDDLGDHHESYSSFRGNMNDKINSLLFVVKGHEINPFEEGESQGSELYALDTHQSVGPA